MSRGPDTIFVYGTLMSAAETAMGRAERERLHRGASSLGPATVAGALVDLGAYPGLVPPRGPDDVVHGEVLRLADRDAVFGWLDAYEGIRPDAGVPASGEYERVVRDARLADGTMVAAWVYLFVARSDGFPPIAGGRWITPR